MRYTCWLTKLGGSMPKFKFTGVVFLMSVAALAQEKTLIELPKFRRAPDCDASKPCPQPVTAARRGGGKMTGSMAIAAAEPDSAGQPQAKRREMLAAQPSACDGGGEARSSFRAFDEQAYHRVVLTGVTPGDVIDWEWWRPDGALYRGHKLISAFGGRGCFWDGIPIAGQEASLLPGDWKVRVSVNGARVAEDTFTLASPGADLFLFKASAGRAAERAALGFRIPRNTLAFVWNGFSFFGFAVARAACAGDGAIPADALNLIKTGDMEGLIGALTALNASGVFRFDVARVRSIRDSLGNLSGSDTADLLINLFNDLFTQVQGARVSCCQNDNPPLFGPPIFELFLRAAFRVGLVEALTISCQSCSDPLDPGIAGFISDQLTLAQAELTVFAPCIVGYDIVGSFNIAQANLAGSVLQAYVPLTGILAYVPQSIGSNNCFCDSTTGVPVTTGTVRGTVRNASTNQPVAGATVTIVGTSISVTTASDGTYTLNNVPSGAQTLRVSANGFTSRDTSISVTAGQTLTQDVLLTMSGGTGTGTVRGVVRNAQNANLIGGATISIVGTSISTTSASDGSFTLNNVPAGAQTLRAAATGFISADAPITVTGGQTTTQNISLSPTLQTGETRITLNWTKDAQQRPDDLDLHLTGPNPDGSSCFHVYYGNTGSLTSAPFAMLEVDNIQLPGHPPAETNRIARLTPGTYRIYIHHYSGEFGSDPPGIMEQSRATVAAFSGNAQALPSTTIPGGTQFYWLVATINGQTGAFTVVNQLVAAEPSASPCR
jgi:Carboxypeptidase regulatory-like domain